MQKNILNQGTQETLEDKSAEVISTHEDIIASNQRE